MIEQKKYINEIAKQMLNNNIALFVGAGFSAIFGYPNWGELLNSIIDEYDLKDKLKSTSLFSFVDKIDVFNTEEISDMVIEQLLGVDYLRLAGYIDYILQDEEGISIHEAVVEKILKYEDMRGKNDDIEFLINFFQNHKGYLEDIITTNYDSNIEYCLKNEVSVIHRNIESLNEISFKNKVFKIHGCIKDSKYKESSGIVITEKDYNNFRNKNKYLFYKIYSFFTEKKIVFIGYSINDPNIRSLLNDVIEESGNNVALDIYWINKYKLNTIDKEYYEDNFKLKIIEEIGIIDFFKELEGRVVKNIELKRHVDASLEEYCMKYIENYEDQSFIEDAIKSDRAEKILQCLYNILIEQETTKALRAYFMLLAHSNTNIIMENKLYIYNILEVQDRKIFSIFDLLESNSQVRSFIKENEFVNITLNSLIEFAKADHAFGEYAQSIKYLLIAYQLFPEEVKCEKEEFMGALQYNILASCSDSPMYYGYDWRGLGEVKENIKALDPEDLIILVNKLSTRYIDRQRSLQIEYVIKYSALGDEEKEKLLYESLYKKQFKEGLTFAVRRAMRMKLEKEYIFEKIEMDKYISNDFEVDFKIIQKEGFTEYVIVKTPEDKELIKITQSFTNRKVKIVYGGKEIEYTNYNQFEDHKDTIQKEIEKALEKHIKQHGIIKPEVD